MEKGKSDTIKSLALDGQFGVIEETYDVKSKTKGIDYVSTWMFEH